MFIYSKFMRKTGKQKRRFFINVWKVYFGTKFYVSDSVNRILKNTCCNVQHNFPQNSRLPISQIQIFSFNYNPTGFLTLHI